MLGAVRVSCDEVRDGAEHSVGTMIGFCGGARRKVLPTPPCIGSTGWELLIEELGEEPGEEASEEVGREVEVEEWRARGVLGALEGDVRL